MYFVGKEKVDFERLTQQKIFPPSGGLAFFHQRECKIRHGLIEALCVRLEPQLFSESKETKPIAFPHNSCKQSAQLNLK